VIAFLVIGGIGFFMLVLTWFLGELFDFGHDVAGWFGDHLGEINVDGHHLELGGADGATDAGPSPLSSRVIFAFMTAFGGGGAIASLYHLPMVGSVLVALAAGLAIGGATFGVARLLFQQQASSTVQASSLVGRSGRVEIGIPDQGAGQVAVAAGGGTSTLLARSRTGRAIPAGASVRIAEVQGNLLIVEAEAPEHPAGGSPAR